MLLVDGQHSPASQGVAVDTAQGAVVDDAHTVRQDILEHGELADGHRCFVLVLAAGDVGEGEDDAGPVAIGPARGEEPLGAADLSFGFLAILVVHAGGGVHAVVAEHAGALVDGFTLPCFRDRSRDHGVAHEELSSLRAAPDLGNAGREEPLFQRLPGGVAAEGFFECVAAWDQQLVHGVLELVA
ncbi:hypothetical protein OHS70_21535 [Streptomyces sp. NBC_00390]|uniref:hypothetical protein n=1 Tax=Streptomyces sp. NBC_00390 TaxID=2975736 RepID=UPI002E1D5662